ncbi:MAG TPA: tetratricopeptide repeat protein [Chthoniobacterales bacterium]
MKRISALCLAAALGLCPLPTAKAQGNPESAKLARQGSEAAKAADWDKAIAAFRKAAEMDAKWNTNLAAALQQRGAVYMSQQKFPEAAADFTEALKITPRDAAIHERRAYVEMKLHEVDKALADYSEAIKINPQEIRYYMPRAYIYEVKGDLKNSMADTEHVLKVDKNNAEAQARKARLEKIQKMKANEQANAPGNTPIPAPPPKK